MDSIGDSTPLSSQREIELGERIKLGDKEALNKLVYANLKFVVSYAKNNLKLVGMPLEDQIAAGNMGLIKAAEQFDSTRGFKFVTYAVWWIRQSILKDYAANYSSQVRRPMYVHQQNLKLNRLMNEFETINERPPNEEELEKIYFEKYGEEIQLSEPHIRGTFSGLETSLQQPMRSDESGKTTFGDTIPDESMPDPTSTMDLDSLIKDVREAVEGLDGKEKEIVKKYFGIDREPVPMKEIAKDYNLSRERVRQIKEKALSRLRYPARSKHLKVYDY